jgi:endonuclease YncB( thermonuclease family)
MQRTAALLCGLLLLVGFAQAGTLSGRVVSLSDVDTITVLDPANKQHKIRLAGIDAPEKAQPFGTRARQYLSELIYLKDVDVIWRKHDRYGRIVGKILVAPPGACSAVEPRCPKTLDVGLAQIAVGLAWHYKQYANEQTEEDRKRYAVAEYDAKAKRAGLWQDRNPVPPWEWRHKSR